MYLPVNHIFSMNIVTSVLIIGNAQYPLVNDASLGEDGLRIAPVQHADPQLFDTSMLTSLYYQYYLFCCKWWVTFHPTMISEILVVKRLACLWVAPYIFRGSLLMVRQSNDIPHCVYSYGYISGPFWIHRTWLVSVSFVFHLIITTCTHYHMDILVESIRFGTDQVDRYSKI